MLYTQQNNGNLPIIKESNERIFRHSQRPKLSRTNNLAALVERTTSTANIEDHLFDKSP